MTLKKRPSTHPDFTTLTRELDQDLCARYGWDQQVYDTHNRIDPIPTAMVVYRDDQPAACGCFRPIDGHSVEIKRMYVNPSYRRQGLAYSLLSALEEWAGELGYKRACLETGKRQPEAIRLYSKAGYRVIPNYGPYTEMDNAVCMEKHLGDQVR